MSLDPNTLEGADREQYERELAAEQARLAAEARSAQISAAARAAATPRTVTHATADVDAATRATATAPVAARNVFGRSIGDATDLIAARAARSNRSADELVEQVANIVRGFARRGADHTAAVDASGGILIPEEWSNTIVELMAVETPLADSAFINIVPMSREVQKVPVEVGEYLPSATVQGEADEYNQGNGTTTDDTDYADRSRVEFDMVELVARKWGDILTISEELLNDSPYDLVNFVTPRIARGFAKRRERFILTGNGTSQPQGILTAVAGTTSTATTSTELANEVESLYFGLKAGYRNRAVWFANSQMMQKLNSLRDSNGNKLLGNPRGDEPFVRLLGRPVVEVDQMPVVADVDGGTAGNQPGTHLILADLRTGYIFGRRRGLELKTSTEGDYFKRDLVAFKASERYDGKVVLTEAIRILRNVKL